MDLKKFLVVGWTRFSSIAGEYSAHRINKSSLLVVIVECLFFHSILFSRPQVVDVKLFQIGNFLSERCTRYFKAFIFQFLRITAG